MFQFLFPISLIPEWYISTLENNPMVTTLEGKIYVLATTKLDMLDATHLFQVFDPSNLSWKHIPLPPKFLNNSSLISHTRWGCHKILMYTYSGSYVFDSRKETWEHAIAYGLDHGHFQAIEEYEGFFIGVDFSSDQLVACRLDSNGIPTWSSYKVLLELDMIFGRGFDPMNDDIFIGKCEGRMWLVNSYEGPEAPGACSSCVVVFRVFIAKDHAGDPNLISAHLEAAEIYDFSDNNYLHSVFAMCHDDSEKKDDLFETVLPSHQFQHHI